MALQARLHLLTNGYLVMHDGRMLVYRSRDPECDAARALSAMNRTGVLIMLDGQPGGRPGKPRTIINIEKAARLTVKEGPHGPRFVKYEETVSDRPYSPEEAAA